MSRHKPEDPIKGNIMLCLADTSLFCGAETWTILQNHCCPDLMPLRRCGSRPISHSIENIMDRKDDQRGSIEKDGNRQRNSETIQDEEITVSRTSYKA